MKKVIVIGSSIAGLSIAIRLQSKGYNVTIVEKNDNIGSNSNQYTEQGYVFDMGPTLITAIDTIESIFKLANKNIDDYLTLTPIDPFFRIYFQDGTFMDYDSNVDRMKIQIAGFNHRDADRYDEFMKHSQRVYDDLIFKGYLSQPYTTLSSMIKLLPKAFKYKLYQSNYTVVSKYFDDPRSKFAFSFHPIFVGANPFNTSSIYSMIPFLEKTDGVWHIKGGIYSIVLALKDIFEELGGKIITSTPVEEIIVKERAAKGIKTKDGIIDADIIISDIDIHHTYANLIGTDKSKRWNPDRLLNSKYSISNMNILLGVKGKYDKLHNHTIIAPKNFKDYMTAIFDKNSIPYDFMMYISVPSKSDSSMAPDDCDSINITIPVTNLKSGTDWEEHTQKFTNNVINYLEAEFDLVNLRKNIVVEKTFTPLDCYRNYDFYLGSPWGLEPTFWQSAYFRPHNKSEDYDNLYFVGPGTHPGGSIPGLIISSEVTEKCINSDFS